jgi:hypothetical protein
VSERKWLPAEWLDESVPALGTSPDAFLLKGFSDIWMLAAADEQERADDSPPCRLLAPGEEVEFCWHEDRGTSVLTINDDGSWRCDPPFDADTNCISDIDSDVMGQSVEDYIEQMKSWEGLEPGEHKLWGWVWSDGTTFRLKVLESGAASFEEVQTDAA